MIQKELVLQKQYPKTIVRTTPDGFRVADSKKNTINDSSGKKLHILFAEDKIIQQKVIYLMLTSLGHTVTIARNGNLALELFRPGKFDLILMDIQMPVMDGVAATQKLKKKYKNLPPIVGLSANASEGDREKYMAMGLDEYLTKPVKKNDFKRLICKIFTCHEFSL